MSLGTKIELKANSLNYKELNMLFLWVIGYAKNRMEADRKFCRS